MKAFECWAAGVQEQHYQTAECGGCSIWESTLRVESNPGIQPPQLGAGGLSDLATPSLFFDFNFDLKKREREMKAFECWAAGVQAQHCQTAECGGCSI
jgi:hypothetical protein